MSLLDDFIESSEAAHGTSTIQYGADTFTSTTNGFDGQDNVRVSQLEVHILWNTLFIYPFYSWKQAMSPQDLVK